MFQSILSKTPALITELIVLKVSAQQNQQAPHRRCRLQRTASSQETGQKGGELFSFSKYFNAVIFLKRQSKDWLSERES